MQTFCYVNDRFNTGDSIKGFQQELLIISALLRILKPTLALKL